MKLALFCLVLLLQLRLATASTNDETVAAIQKQYSEWERAYESKDLAGVMAVFAPDAIATFAGASDTDAAAMGKSYESTFAKEGPARQWKAVDLEVQVSGDLAYALTDWQLLEGAPDGSMTKRLTNRSIDLLKRDGNLWRIIRAFSIPNDERAVKMSCDVALPHISPESFAGASREVWETLMRWREAYNARDLAGTLAPFDAAITGLYAGSGPDDLARLRETYMHSFAATDRQRSIDFEPEEILTSGDLAFVRDHWTSTIRTEKEQERRLSRGIEVWHKDSEGKWKLLHYLSYLVCKS